MKTLLKNNLILLLCVLAGLVSGAVILSQRSAVEQASRGYDIVIGYDDIRALASASGESEENWLGLFSRQGVDKLAVDAALLPGPAAIASDLGYTVIPLPRPGDAPEAVEKYPAPYFFNTGDSLWGYDGADAAALESYLDAAGAHIVLTETEVVRMNLSWPGFDELVARRGYDAVRCFYMSDEIRSRYAVYGYEGAEEIVNALYRAVYERNCRLIYFRPICRQSGELITDGGEYTALFSTLRDRLNRRGFVQGVLEPVDNYFPSMVLIALVGLGAIAAAVMIVSALLRLSRRLTLLLTVCFLGFVGVLCVSPDIARLLLSMGGGTAIPCGFALLLARYIIPRADTPARGGTLAGAAGACVLTALLGLCGGIFAASPISDTAFMLEQKLYRGVKLMQLVPIAVFIASVICLYLSAFRGRIGGFRGALAGVKSKLLAARASLRPVHILLILLLLAVLALAGAYYIIRIGNTNVVLTPEYWFRHFLERTLAARPRFKEFALGYPCVMLLVWSVRRRVTGLPLLFGLGAVIGAVSVVNTFLHIRTFVAVSLWRVFYGLVFGLALGAAAYLLAELIYRLCTKKGAHG